MQPVSCSNNRKLTDTELHLTRLHVCTLLII